MRFGELHASLWLSVARCVARSVIAVAGKFASILICGLDSSCVTHSHNHSHNPFCVFAFLVVRDFFGLTKKRQEPFVRLDAVCVEEYLATGRFGDPGNPLPLAQFSVWACT